MGDANSTVTTNVDQAWARLGTVRNLTFKSHSRSVVTSGWEGDGAGDVVVAHAGPCTLVFHETGTWRSVEGREFQFSNSYRWTLDRAHPYIRLEHLRFGADRPVLLFDLVPATDGTLQSAAGHVCSDDCYSARLSLDPDLIHLDWKITGPKTDEAISYCYQ